jgi:hypothetical protein
MDHSTEPAGIARLIVPGALFLGVGLGLAACCLAGAAASRRNPFRHFERFHVYLTPESLFYPTACQVRALAKSRLDPHRIAVVVGGNSIMHGAFQSPSGVWTRKLQALLGDRFQVINFGFRGAGTGEFGATAAEVLGRDYPRLILISDLSPGWIHPDPDGSHFKYFFWDAQSRGWLLPHEERDRRLRELAINTAVRRLTPAQEGKAVLPSPGEQQAELRAQMRLNRRLYFNDLWNTLAYTRFCTVWTPRTRESFLRARRHHADPEPEPIFTIGDRGDNYRNYLAAYARSPREAWDHFEHAATGVFPTPTRLRTLLLVLRFSPRFRDNLSVEEWASYLEVSRRSVQRLERLGFAALEVGAGFPAADFIDLCHLTEAGGAKMAEAVAPKVRQLARQLAYLP